MYYVYIVQCKDRSLYTGITTDVQRRIKEHNLSQRGAKYTRARGPVRLVYVKEFLDRSTSSIAEATIKKLSRFEKINLIKKARQEHLIALRVKKDDGNKKYTDHKEEARSMILVDLERLNIQYGFLYNRVAIRNQTTRWGSCSKNKNLNFNYHLLFLTKEERAYVIVHELCHLAEMNHSKNFWDLVARACPDYRKYRSILKHKNMSNLY